MVGSVKSNSVASPSGIVGGLISIALHGAAAATLWAGHTDLGGAGGANSAMSVTTFISVAVDSVAEDTPVGAVASSMVVAPAPPSAATVTTEQKEPERDPVPESEAIDAVLPASPEVEPKEKKPIVEEAVTAAAQPAAPAPTATPEAQSAERVQPERNKAAAASASRGDMVRYANKVRTRLAAHRPTGIGLRGRTVVTLRISQAGDLELVELVEPSGNPRLDRLCIASIRSAAPFPLPPVNASAEQRTFSVPFEFK